ncbi:MAG: hypothetical protein EBU57_05480 [Alphaproteobacteria bacterium]|nr:hypothetical protein [Alphaproteobacteria bacterium]
MERPDNRMLSAQQNGVTPLKPLPALEGPAIQKAQLKRRLDVSGGVVGERQSRAAALAMMAPLRSTRLNCSDFLGRLTQLFALSW